MELCDVMIDVFFSAITEEIKFGLIGIDDYAVCTDKV